MAVPIFTIITIIHLLDNSTSQVVSLKLQPVLSPGPDPSVFFIPTPQTKGLHVVISAKFKTGGSYVEQFLNRNQDFICHSLPHPNNASHVLSANMVHLISGILDCSLTEEDGAGYLLPRIWRQTLMCGYGK